MLSRFWYFLVAVLAGAGIAAAFMAQDQINRTAAAAVEESIRRDRAEIELWLRYDARLRIDDIAPMAAHSDVRSALKRASARRDRSRLDESVRSGLGARLAELNQQLQEGAAQLLFAVDAEGEIIAQLGGDAPPSGAGLGTFPLVQRTLRGFVGDDVWVYNGKVYRMAARPVIDGGQYVGAVVHGSEVSAALAQRLATRVPGATLAFFLRDGVIAAHVPASEGAVQQNTLREGIAAALADESVTSSLADGTVSDTRELTSGRFAIAFVRGTAAHAQVGYAIARGHVPMASPTDLFRSQESLDAVPWPIVVGASALLGLIGLLFIFVELARPLRGFRVAAKAVGSGHSQRIDEATMKGAFRSIAADVNAALERAQASGSAKKPSKDLDEILGPKDEGAPKGGGYFGFAQDDAGPEATPPKPAAPLQPPAAPKPPAAPPAAPKPPAARQPPAPRPPAPPPTSPEPRRVAGSFDDDEADGATMIANVPKELLAAAAEANEDDAHFNEVFEKFVAMKTECGESTTGLTADKFKQTLRKNRDAIVSKHGAKTVRFTVYNKDGKAALKATPVKD